ncbi:MAG: acyl-CoA dehydrogenase family protein [Bdellovibrionales bacterium]|nr:acyl-CoA dehydrogenase family protein [Bdellovibrionales bacterium]
MGMNHLEDFYQIDELLTEDERMVRDSVRQFVDREIMPNISDWFEKGHFPAHLTKPMAELGIFGATIKGYGCAGLSSTAYGLIMTEIERADSGLRSFVSVQGALAMHAINAYGTEEQKQRFLPKMASGEIIGCFGLTEPDFGSNPGGMLTTARKDGNSYVINGNKMWITNGAISGLAIVWAKIPEEGGKIGGFIVEREHGYKAPEIERKFSLRASNTSELVLEDVRVPAKNRLEITGLRGPIGCLFQARYGISWGVIGAAQACFTEALNYAKSRIQFDRPIAGFQLVQAKLVKMHQEITKAQLLAWRLGRLKDEGRATIQQVSLAKMNNVAMALDCARVARDILGGSGITLEYSCGRHMMNLESVITYEGTDDIHRLILGEHITGIAAYAGYNPK